MGEMRRRIGYGLGGAVLAAGSLLPGAGVAAAADPCTTVGATTTCSYGYTGGEQSFTVPAGVTSVHVDAVGASGAQANPWPLPREVPTPSSGAHVSGQLTGLSAGQVLYVEVGGAASDGAGCDAGMMCHGGFNGGGSSSRFGGGGGGASDVRTVSGSDASSLTSRLIVAAGGGGGAGGAGGCEILAGAPLPGGVGGNAGAAGGGGQVCDDGVVARSTGGGAGTATAPGAAGLSIVVGGVAGRGVAGALGVGADAAPSNISSAGGGGGGLYGGGSGSNWALDGDGTTAIGAGGGGGGSSFTPAGGTVGLAGGPASVTITYTLPLGETPNQLTALGQAVAGVGPGTSLSDKVATAQQDLARGDTAGACAALTGFVNQVTAQSGKKIPVATATQLAASAHGIQAAIGC